VCGVSESRHGRDVGYPDVEKIDEDRYWVHIPIPADPGSDRRGSSHDGGTVDVYVTGDQLNEWINRFSDALQGGESP
jgi:hypothetical protein